MSKEYKQELLGFTAGNIDLLHPGYINCFKAAKNFPRPCDNLHNFPLRKWGELLFIGFNPVFDFYKVINKRLKHIKNFLYKLINSEKLLMH